MASELLSSKTCNVDAEEQMYAVGAEEKKGYMELFCLSNNSYEGRGGDGRGD